MKRSPSWKDSFRLALLIFVPLRLALSFFVALIFWLSPGLAQPLQTEVMTRWGIPIPANWLAHLFFNPWLRFDAIWFLKIALNGYDLSEPNISHLPLYPLLIRLLHTLTGGHIGLSALLIANAAFIVGLAYMHQLSRLDYSETITRRAMLYLALFPTAFFYLTGYTESLFLLAVVGAFFYARRQAWLWAGLMGAVAALIRPQGFLIIIPLVVEFWQSTPHRRRTDWLKLWPLLFIPLSLALYALYLHLNFDLPVIWRANLAYWRMQSGFSLPGYNLWLTVETIWQGLHPFNNSVDLLFALFGLLMTVWGFWRLRFSYSLFLFLNILISISRSIEQHPLHSVPRYILPLFPMYLLLAQASQNSPLLHRLIIYSWLGLWLFFSLQFALGGWVA